MDKAAIWRTVNSIGWIIALVLTVANQHSIENCQANLYEYITGKEAPSHFELHKGDDNDSDR